MPTWLKIVLLAFYFGWVIVEIASVRALIKYQPAQYSDTGKIVTILFGAVTVLLICYISFS